MIYFCTHYKQKINPGKALNYCLKTNCWAFRLLTTNQLMRIARRIKKRCT